MKVTFSSIYLPNETKPFNIEIAKLNSFNVIISRYVISNIISCQTAVDMLFTGFWGYFVLLLTLSFRVTYDATRRPETEALLITIQRVIDLRDQD